MVFEKVAAIIADYKDLDIASVTAESAFADLGFDSLDIVEMIMSLEEEFGITLKADQGFKTVGDLTGFIEETVNA